MRRNNEIEYIKAEEYLKGRFEAELTNLAFARGLLPEKLASRIFVGNHPRNEEFVSDAQTVQVHLPKRKSVRVSGTGVRKRGKQVEDSGSTHGKTHRRKLTKAQKKAKNKIYQARYAAKKAGLPLPPLPGGIVWLTP